MNLTMARRTQTCNVRCEIDRVIKVILSSHRNEVMSFHVWPLMLIDKRLMVGINFA